MVSSLANGQIDAFIWVQPQVSKAVELGAGKFHSVLLKGYVTYGTVETLKSTVDARAGNACTHTLCD